MKKCIGIFMVILLLIGCEEEQKKEFEKEVPNEYGNSYGNLRNDGFVAKQGNLLVYMKYNSSGIPFVSTNSIMAKKENDTKEVEITSRGFGHINVMKEWIYYTVIPFSDEPMLYRIKLDGTEREKLLKNAHYVQVKNDEIYYYDSLENGLYKINLNGSDKVHIYSPKAEVTMNFVVDHEQIYFYKPIDEYGDSGKLYSMSLDGDNIKKLNDTVDNFQIISGIDEEHLYYINVEEQLYQVDKVSGMVMKISDEIFLSIIIEEGWIYYLNAADHYHLYKMKKNGDQNTLLIEKDVSDINVLDNWIYYKIEDNEDIFRVKTDGTKNMLFSEHKSDFD